MRYLSKAMITWHKKDKNNRMYCNIEDGKKISMPRYYKNKIYHEAERKAIGVFQRQKLLIAQSILEQNPEFERNKFESAKAQFNKMYHNSSKGDKI